MKTKGKKGYSVSVDPEQVEGLQEIRDRDGVSISEQVRRAISEWLKVKKK